MALLIGEGGSSNVDWAVITGDGNEITSFSTSGLNPFYHGVTEIADILKKHLLPQLTDVTAGIDAVMYYGAGCAGESNRSHMATALQKVIGENKYIEVYDDLLGAARASLGNQPGIVCILGTGQNSGKYDGHAIVDQIPPLGFALGDEGSGASIGRKLIQAYFYRELPEELMHAFEEEFKPNRVELLMKVYSSSSGNRYVAEYARFAGKNCTHPFIKELLYKEFAEMIERHLLKYNSIYESSAAMVGSVSYYFKDQILDVFNEYELKLGDVLEKPINGLIKFHN